MSGVGEDGLALRAIDCVTELKLLIVELEAILEAAVLFTEFRPIADPTFRRMMVMLDAAHRSARAAFEVAEARSRELQREHRRARRPPGVRRPQQS